MLRHLYADLHGGMAALAPLFIRKLAPSRTDECSTLHGLKCEAAAAEACLLPRQMKLSRREEPLLNGWQRVQSS